MDFQKARNADVVAFLRRGLTSAEQQWPRFEPRLRTMADVPVAELRTHPDLVRRLIDVAGSHAAEARILMGTPDLIASSGIIYAVTFSMRFFALRLSELTDARSVTDTPSEPIGENWCAVNVWLDGVPAAEWPDALRALERDVTRARIAAEQV